jgi:outer membrane lipoprotein
VRPLPLFAPLVALSIAGCASGDCRPAVGDRAITPVLAATSERYVGRLVQWGGLLIDARNLKASTELEVVGHPLDSCGRPRLNTSPTGRFIIARPGYLEPLEFRVGRKITASGRITEVRGGTGGSMSGRFPVLESFNPYLWPEGEKQESYRRPWVSIGIGGGSGGVGGGIGVTF